MDKCVSFDIDKDVYKTFIKNLSKHVLAHSTSHRIRELMQPLGRLNWLDVELIAGDYRITLRLDRRTLCVLAYSRKVDTYFWKFDDEYTSQIPGPLILGYSGSYAGGLVSAAGIGRDLLELGYHPLQNAICNLAVMDNPHIEKAQSAKSLLTISQMITEAARIELIAKHIIRNWWNAKPISPRMVELENAWGTSSSSELIYDSYSSTLVSIEYVRVKSFFGKSSVKLYGTVKVADCFVIHDIYKRSSDNAESKGLGDSISLTSPSVAVNGQGAFTIFVSLWDHNIGSLDKEIAKGDVVWDPVFRLPSDKLMVEDVHGECGSVTVAYSVVSLAVSAIFNIVLFNGAGKSPVDVYGMIKATIEAPQYKSSRTLFDKSKDECVKVRHREQFLSLTCPVFPVPINSYITIEADLQDRHSLPHNDEIAQGSVQFTPAFGTQPFKTIRGKKHMDVRVSITCE